MSKAVREFLRDYIAHSDALDGLKPEGCEQAALDALELAAFLHKTYAKSIAKHREALLAYAVERAHVRTGYAKFEFTCDLDDMAVRTPSGEWIEVSFDKGQEIVGKLVPDPNGLPSDRTLRCALGIIPGLNDEVITPVEGGAL